MTHLRLRASAVLVSLLAFGCGDESVTPTSPGGGAGDGKADGLAGQRVHFTSQTAVEQLEGRLESVVPAVNAVHVGGATDPATYLKPMSCLGYLGPIGPYGPLGLMGPVGDGFWNPSRYISDSLDWSGFSATVTTANGPLSADGPLGAKGPLNPALWGLDADEAGAISGGFVSHLAPGGVWSVLGPAGPLGPLGPLGALGPIGAHGYQADDDGQWLAGEDGCHHEGSVCRSVDVPWDEAEVRSYPLFEHYGEGFAKAMPDNDTSFMVTGAIDDDTTDAYAFTSATAQSVIVTVVPAYAELLPAQAMTLLYEAAALGFDMPRALPFYPWLYDHSATYDDFDLVLKIVDAEGTVLGSITSASAESVDWIQAQVPAGARLVAEVSLFRSWWAWWRSVDPGYRLIVVGGTPEVAAPVEISGKHRQVLTLSDR